MGDGPNATPAQPRAYGSAPWERAIEPVGSHPDIDVAPEPSNTPWTPPPALNHSLPDPTDDEWTRRLETEQSLREPRRAVPEAPRPAGPAPNATAPKAPQPPAPSAHETGSHSLSVADLLAREGANGSRRSRRHARTQESDDYAEEPAPASSADGSHTDVLPQVLEAAPQRAQYTDGPADEHPQYVDYPDDAPLYDKAAARRVRASNLDDNIDTRAIPVRVGNPDAAVREEEPKRSRRPIYLGRSIAAVVAVCSLTVTGGAWQWSNVKNNRLNHVEALDPNSRDIRDPNAQYGDENFLIIGVDTRAGANSAMGAGDTSDAEGTRSDTMMLVNIPANRKRVAVVSFPRDLAIQPTLCEVWNEDTKSYGPDKAYTETKLNSAFAFGGPKCLVKVIQKMSGLNINRFLGVDFAGFSKMVDALGGVEVCTPTPIEDYELGTVLQNAGRQTIDGHTALQYVRARQVTTEYNGDYGRIKRQQLFLSSLLRSMISHNTFFSLSKLNNVVNTFIDDSYVDNIRTKDLVDLGQSLQDVKAGRITFLTVPTDGTDSEGNETPRTTDIRKIFDAIINDDPLPGELLPDGTRVPMPGTTTQDTTLAASEHGAASELGETFTAPPTPAATPTEQVDLVTTEPSEINVHVSNSTGQTGLAASAASQLSNYGFGITTTDDYPSALPTTTVFFSPGHEQQAATVAASFGGAKLQRITGAQTTVRVVLGSDYASTANLQAPPAAGSTVPLQLSSGAMAPTELPMDLTVVNAGDTSCG
ncbi:Putative transcriptional regulator [Mycobacteroides abscessus subsp. bolletii]|uniref:LCP family protein n=1 Tax=Mycobacteroides abscessus TaxID=36809 RepID=UPI000928BD48|nr:LCP family protein [Mycobacteroides abscessus]SHY76289.1 Putative transcriptional regulator [Mycobacteroides abscessus subsp. bolletii]SKP89345.1 Putative transcriptional regulator [Mycobacteroides abscessus subsp. bolletii]SKQ36015.1 Putative transcriptional regulator [Mycobacteroides abscessus subsp. bolletii]SKQ51262.1 Putative transcriptional regulator [Mycobacteroides abscessus subsp. bolletii]